VTVPLLGSTRDIRGMDLPEGLHAERVGSADLLRPQILTIHLPDGRSLTLTARSLSLISLDGIVEGVYARRPMHPVRFKEAVADLRRTLEALKIEPDRQMAEQMAGWPEDTPGVGEGVDPYDFKAAHHSAFGSIGGIDIRVSPDPDRGWYYLIIFGASVEASKAAHEAAKAKTPLAKPSGAEGGKEGPTPPAGFASVSVPLLGSTRDVRGMALPAAIHTLQSGSADLPAPHALTINLPGDKPLWLLARATSLSCRDGVVESISIRRPMLPLPFNGAIEDMVRTAKAMRVDPEKLKTQMAGWPEPPGDRELSAVVRAAFEGVDLSLQVTPDPKGGWTYLMTLNPAAETKHNPK
jgi:hypothetical protein